MSFDGPKAGLSGRNPSRGATFLPLAKLAGTRGNPVKRFTAWILIKEGVEAFIEDNALTRGAAIAFYAVTAIAPVLFIASAIAALGLGQDAASGAVHYQLTRIMTTESADLVQLAILHMRNSTHNLAGSLIGLAA